MNANRSSSFLRLVLLLDAVCSGIMGIGLLLFAQPLAGLLRLPANLLSDAALVLIPFAAFVGWLASRQLPHRAAVWAVIVINVLWVADSVILLFTGWVAPNALGYAFIIGQAIAVGVFAELEFIGLRRMAGLAPVKRAAGIEAQ